MEPEGSMPYSQGLSNNPIYKVLHFNFQITHIVNLERHFHKLSEN